MARIRTVKPEFWQHPKVTSVPRDARLLFLGLLNEADDEGKLRYSGKRLAGVLFGEDDDVGAAEIDAWTGLLECAGLVHRYEVDGAALLIVCGFTEHQRVSHPTPSRLPNPPEVLAKCSGVDLEVLRPEGKGREEEQGSAFAQDFDEWWQHYPKKTDKAKARENYTARRRAGTSAEDLISARDNYLNANEGADPQFVKGPAVFLRGKDGPWSEWVAGEPDGFRASMPVRKPEPVAAGGVVERDGKRFFPGTGWI